MGQRTMLVTAHTGRANAMRSARQVAERLTSAGITVRTLAGELSYPGAEEVPAGPEAAEGAELVIVLGGDGSLLRAAELSRPAQVPLIGVNLGHVGFLAEAEPDGLADLVDRVAARKFTVEERMTIDVAVRANGAPLAPGWALNEATIEKAARERMIEVITEVDGRPLSRWGCDGVVCSTPTGSTAYAYLRGRPGGLARGGGAAHGADQRARAVRAADGGLAPVGARGRAAGRRRSIGRGAVVRRSA